MRHMNHITAFVPRVVNTETGCEYELSIANDVKNEILSELEKIIEHLANVSKLMIDEHFPDANAHHNAKISDIIEELDWCYSSINSSTIVKSKVVSGECFFYEICIFKAACEIKHVYIETRENKDWYINDKQFLDFLVCANVLTINERNNAIEVKIIDKETYERNIDYGPV